MPRAIYNADLVGLPAALPPLADVCKAAHWALLGAQSALENIWHDFDRKLNSDETALAVHRAGEFACAQ